MAYWSGAHGSYASAAVRSVPSLESLIHHFPGRPPPVEVARPMRPQDRLRAVMQEKAERASESASRQTLQEAEQLDRKMAAISYAMVTVPVDFE